MAVLNSTLSCGVTATAHKKDDLTTESSLLEKLGFSVYALFPSNIAMKVEDFRGKNL